MSYYTSLSGLNAAATDLQVTSNNIANVGTTGFKKSRAEFGDIVANSLFQSSATPGLGTSLREIDQQFTQGSFKTTDETLNLAISGQGFFVTRDGIGTGTTALTRDGAFGTDDQGYVVDGSGNYLQVLPAGSDTGDLSSLTTLRVPPTTGTDGRLSGLSIAEDGTVAAAYSDGTSTTLGRVALANVTNPRGLIQAGDSKWGLTPSAGDARVSGAASGGMGVVKSGMVETSNVDITAELVQLIQAQRNFQANAKAIDTASQLTEIAVNLRT